MDKEWYYNYNTNDFVDDMETDDELLGYYDWDEDEQDIDFEDY